MAGTYLSLSLMILVWAPWGAVSQDSKNGHPHLKSPSRLSPWLALTAQFKKRPGPSGQLWYRKGLSLRSAPAAGHTALSLWADHMLLLDQSEISYMHTELWSEWCSLGEGRVPGGTCNTPLSQDAPASLTTVSQSRASTHIIKSIANYECLPRCDAS